MRQREGEKKKDRNGGRGRESEGRREGDRERRRFGERDRRAERVRENRERGERNRGGREGEGERLRGRERAGEREGGGEMQEERERDRERAVKRDAERKRRDRTSRLWWMRIPCRCRGRGSFPCRKTPHAASSHAAPHNHHPAPQSLQGAAPGMRPTDTPGISQCLEDQFF